MRRGIELKKLDGMPAHKWINNEIKNFAMKMRINRFGKYL